MGDSSIKKMDFGELECLPECCRVGTQREDSRLVLVREVAQGKHQKLRVCWGRARTANGLTDSGIQPVVELQLNLGLGVADETAGFLDVQRLDGAKFHKITQRWRLLPGVRTKAAV